MSGHNIHRWGLNGGTVCGAPPDAFGHRKVSNTGVLVTCPACIGPHKERNREAALAAIKEAADRWQGVEHHPECKPPYYGGGMFGCISRCPVQTPPMRDEEPFTGRKEIGGGEN